MAQFIEFSVYTTHEGGDLVSDLLWNYTQDGVVINDIEDVIELSKTGKTWDYIDEGVLNKDKTVIVSAYFPVLEGEEKLTMAERDLQRLKEESPFDLGSLETSKREVDGDAWREIWKERFKPIPIGKVVIVPEWIDYKEKSQEIKVIIGSNMAFGTGEHETTSMCVEYLSKYVKREDTVLDVGCGSGILGITAAKLGAKKVIMTDIDECAITATSENMLLNNVTNGEVLLKNLLDDNTVKGEIIVCNIMAEVLIAFAPYIMANLTANGHIILSGILKDRLPAVKKAYESAGFTFCEEKIKGEWSALVMKGA